MHFFQKEISLPAFSRGFHLITSVIERELPEIKKIEVGFLQVFIKHTSASLSINENADPTVRKDFETHFNKMVPENAFLTTSTITKDSDDMPAHIKASLLGAQVMIPHHPWKTQPWHLAGHLFVRAQESWRQQESGGYGFWELSFLLLV